MDWLAESVNLAKKNATHFPRMCGVFLCADPAYAGRRFQRSGTRREFRLWPRITEILYDFRYFILSFSLSFTMPSSHFDRDGNAHMVNVSGKDVTLRRATAETIVSMNESAAAAVRKGTAKKGDVLAVARLAAISGTKWTAHLIPLCHAIPIESVEVRFQWQTEPGAVIQRLACQVICQTTGKTGIEMEAMTGASVAGLTVYDMLKSVDRAMQIGATRLLEKSGGESGDFQAP